MTAPAELSQVPKMKEKASDLPKITPLSEVGPEEQQNDPLGVALSDEYNMDDEPEDGQEYSYGWGYEDTLDNPEAVHEGPNISDDEDETYASDPNKE